MAGDKKSVLDNLEINIDLENTAIGSLIFANKPGDGSAREQAASCQKVLGGWANIAIEYATKRYRSNCINWGMIPFEISKEDSRKFSENSWIYIQDVKKAVESKDSIFAEVINSENQRSNINLDISSLSKSEREILLSGCLINNYAGK